MTGTTGTTGTVGTAVNKTPSRIAGMFNAIAPRYDALNHLLSAGLDRGWRRRAVRELHLSGRERVLDMCTGTADLAIEAATSRSGRARQVIGIDFASEMLRLAGGKVRQAGLESTILLARGDATQMPLADASCDAALIGFGIRNVVDPARACREFCRVLRPGGRLAVLEFGSPDIPGIRAAYRWYFRSVLPRVGGWISRHGDAYSYLPASVEAFHTPQAFMNVLETAGFRTVRRQALALGIVSLYLAER
jgi:demethylmenaquinone methyltransferase/2-methoxy-6-polyprenyl-1,4-benzoquinol methylase